MAGISLSVLFGDAASGTFLAWLIGNGLSWRGVFIVAAFTLFLLFVLNAVLLKETPKAIGEAEPEANPMAVVIERAPTQSSDDAFQTLRSVFRNSGFRLVCVLSFMFTLVRETFNLWTPTYFVQVVGLTDADAARKSALFPLFGGISVLLFGIIGDWLK